jgi:hypothetical protein
MNAGVELAGGTPRYIEDGMESETTTPKIVAVLAEIERQYGRKLTRRERRERDAVRTKMAALKASDPEPFDGRDLLVRPDYYAHTDEGRLKVAERRGWMRRQRHLHAELVAAHRLTAAVADRARAVRRDLRRVDRLVGRRPARRRSVRAVRAGAPPGRPPRLDAVGVHPGVLLPA